MNTSQVENQATDINDYVEEMADEKQWYELGRYPKYQSQDPLQEINIGSESDPRPIFVSQFMAEEDKFGMVDLIKEYSDCFAWSYHEMPGLDRSIVEHHLPIKENFVPHIQPTRRMAPHVTMKVKEEVDRLLEAKFIRPCQFTDWLSNIVPVTKKNGKIRVCIDFRNLNKASPKDQYPLPVPDMLVDSTSGFEVMSLMDGHSGYNQIFIAEEDVNKTAFRCPGNIGIFEWIVMPFGLINAGATYQRAMNQIFHDMIGHFVEVYVDDVVVKSSVSTHAEYLRQVFERTRKFKLKMNPLKCAFGVSAGQFLGFLIHQKGIEIQRSKSEAINQVKPPTCKKELQSFLGQVNYLRRFIANCAGKTDCFSPLLKLKFGEPFIWNEEHQMAFETLKQYLMNPPVLVSPKPGQPLKLYISATDTSVGCLLAQDFEEDSKTRERAVYYLSRKLTDVEWRYPPIEKLCLALYFSCIKLRSYMIPVTTSVICKTDIIRYMLSLPIIRGRCAKWSLVMLEFDIKYVPQHAVKGQALADFLAAHPCLDVEPEFGIEIGAISIRRWILMFDGSKTSTSGGIGIILLSPTKEKFTFAFKLMFDCSNNQAEYEALVKGLQISIEFNIKHIDVYGDSMLVVNQVNEEFGCLHTTLQKYLAKVKTLLKQFKECRIRHVPREENTLADELAQLSSRIQMDNDIQRVIVIQKQFRSCLDAELMEVCIVDVKDWRYELIQYLQDPNRKTSRKIRRQAGAYILFDDVLYRKTDDIYLRCLGAKEATQVMQEVHEGICGAHQAGIKMKYLIRRHGYFWPTCLKDCITYAKGCKTCQIHGPIQIVPASEYCPIVKPWPFRGWAMDIMGKISPLSSEQHGFILVATDYFTKWVEAEPFRNIEQRHLIKFVKEKIIHRFGIPETITVDNGPVFRGFEFQDFANEYGFKILYSSPYYAQANGQAEATNKVIKQNLRKMINANPKEWHTKLSQVLWAMRTSQKSGTVTTPFALTYGHDAVLPMEIKIQSHRVTQQCHLTTEAYNEAMSNEMDNLTHERMLAIDKVALDKQRVARAYNKKVKAKLFKVGDLVWKSILPLGKKNPIWGKWSPTWEGPFIIHEVLKNGAYKYQYPNGDVHTDPINGLYLKKYYPTYWELKGY